MIIAMSTVHITETELAADVHAVLEKVRNGTEVIVERDHRAVAIIKTAPGPGRKIGECAALAKAYEEHLGYRPVPDADFARDVDDAVRREPFDPPSWD
jgi:hypothetical protein